MRVVLVALALLSITVPAAAQDLDHDGLPDTLEQALLERFVPTLLLDSQECNGQPASFKPGLRDPFVSAKDGSVYGQAFPVTSTDGRSHVELHFFHLWERDCGRPSHALDVEHVSAIVSAARIDVPLFGWQADIWYAAAHEDTVCDASSGAQARTLQAEMWGPRVYVSRGKHASYFNRGQCKWGCGSDVCDGDTTVVVSHVINIGERDAPLNGADWILSDKWALSSKMQSDFDPAVRASLDDKKDIVSLMLHMRTTQSPILAGDTALDGLQTAAKSTGRALGTASRAVSRFLRLK